MAGAEERICEHNNEVGTYVSPQLASPPSCPAPSPVAVTVIPVPAPPVSQATRMNPNPHQQQQVYPEAQVLHTTGHHAGHVKTNNAYTGTHPAPNSATRDAPPAWATQQPAQSSSDNQGGPIGNRIAKVGQWFQQGLGSSSIGNATPNQRVYNSSTITNRSGGFFSSTAATHRTSVVQEVPSQTGAGRLAKRVGDGAVMSAVWGATTLQPKQILRAAAVATTAYAVEGNQRNRAQQQQEEFIRQKEEEHRREQEERRKNSWIKW